MTEMQLEKIMYLSRLKFAKKKIDSLKVLKENDIKRAKDFLDGFPYKENREAFEKCMAHTEMLKKISAESYNSALNEYNEIYRETIEKIDALADQSLAEVLRLRYIDDMTWEEIAMHTYYSLRNVKYMHKRALDSIKL